MKKQAILLVICLLNAVSSIAAGASLLYSDRPALKWEDALISGNGEQGILVFGEPRHERIIFNHEFLYEYIGAENVAPADISDVMGQVKQLSKLLKDGWKAALPKGNRS